MAAVPAYSAPPRIQVTERCASLRPDRQFAEGWQVVGVTTKKQLLIAPPQVIILMGEMRPVREALETGSLVHAGAR
jgi:hypothetical protein